jgi:uncharacterized protein
MAVVLLALTACGPDDIRLGDFRPGDASRQSPIVPLDTGTVVIETAQDTLRISVEIAETPAQKQVGLMERTAVPDHEGMIFLYDEPQPGDAPFYMFRTRIPLDIAFIDADGRIISVLRMEPCTSPVADWCDRYAPGVPYSGALEVGAGYFERHGVRAGDRILLIR